MISVITDVPSNVVGFRTSGEVKKEDYKSTVLPELDKHLNDHNKINILWVMDTDVSNYTVGAMLMDFKTSIANFTNWKSLAFVTEQDFIKNVAETVSFVLPGEIKGFKHAQLAEAKDWVSKQ